MSTDWRDLMIECLRGQVDMLDALATLVDRETRFGIEERIDSHQRWISRLESMTKDENHVA